MASAATSTIAHNVPPLPMSMVSTPRIRPPRIPKGTPNANTDPQPAGPAPKGKVWVQGKWRETGSRAMQERQQAYSRRLEKALRHETLGTNIYAYNHIRTKQVVYSLTRTMDNNKIMEQLQYHGKKTVPAALRRDMWTPYFSIHFPPTEYGAHAGLIAFRQLRELSLRRQLSPPEDMVRTTQEDIEKFKSRLDPVSLKIQLKDRAIKMPVLGQRLPKKLRAKHLMDQKATSVADVAFVLERHLEGPSPEEVREARVEKFKQRMARMGRRAKTRMQKIRMLEARKRDMIRALDSQTYFMSSEQGNLTLDKHAAQRIALEHHGRIGSDGGVMYLSSVNAAREAKAAEARAAIVDVQAQIDALLAGQPLEVEVTTSEPQEVPTPRSEGRNAETKPKENNPDLVQRDALRRSIDSKPDDGLPMDVGTSLDKERKVKVMWADMRDGTYAPNWPKNVLHGELERFAQSKGELSSAKSIHVMGGEEGSGWATSQQKLSARQQETEKNFEKRQQVAKRLEDEANDGHNLVEKALELVEAELLAEVTQEEVAMSAHGLLVEGYREELKARLRAARPRSQKPEGEGSSIAKLYEEVGAQFEAARNKISAEERGFAFEKAEGLRQELDAQLRAERLASADFDNTRAAIMAQCWKLAPEESERAGIDMVTLILRAQVLRLCEDLETEPDIAQAKGTSKKQARLDSKIFKKPEDVEIELPRSGLLDRLRAVIWRR